MPSTDTKPELTTKASMAQPVSPLAVYANGLNLIVGRFSHFHFFRSTISYEDYYAVT
jgi:hypothetical protein